MQKINLIFLKFSFTLFNCITHQIEKWHLKQINEYSENEIFIKGNKVIVSYGADNDSKVVKRSFTFDSPIFDVRN